MDSLPVATLELERKKGKEYLFDLLMSKMANGVRAGFAESSDKSSFGFALGCRVPSSPAGLVFSVAGLAFLLLEFSVNTSTLGNKGQGSVLKGTS